MQTQSTPAVNVLIKPPTLYLVSIVFGIILNWFLPVAGWQTPLSAGLGLITITAGLLLSIWGDNEFKRYRTPVNPDENPTSLVTSGPYRFTRNPMYVGLTMIQLGVAIVLGSTAVLLTLILTLLIMHYGVILREEAYMRQQFGRAYTEYSGRVRRWL